MADVQVKYVNKTGSSHEHITHLGGDTWTWTRSSVIGSIERGENTFFTFVNGKRAVVGVVDGDHGKYVRTHADGYYNDNLLALPRCIVAAA